MSTNIDIGLHGLGRVRPVQETGGNTLPDQAMQRCFDAAGAAQSRVFCHCELGAGTSIFLD